LIRLTPRSLLAILGSWRFYSLDFAALNRWFVPRRFQGASKIAGGFEDCTNLRTLHAQPRCNLRRSVQSTGAEDDQSRRFVAGATVTRARTILATRSPAPPARGDDHRVGPCLRIHRGSFVPSITGRNVTADLAELVGPSTQSPNPPPSDLSSPIASVPASRGSGLRTTGKRGSTKTPVALSRPPPELVPVSARKCHFSRGGRRAASLNSKMLCDYGTHLIRPVPTLRRKNDRLPAAVNPPGNRSPPPRGTELGCQFFRGRFTCRRRTKARIRGRTLFRGSVRNSR
jgi:hypothetical protein